MQRHLVVVVRPLGSSELRSLAVLMSSGCGPHGRNVVGAPSLLAGWVYGPGSAESGRHQCRAPQQDVPRDVRLLTVDEAQTRRTVDVVAPGALCGRLLANPVQVLPSGRPAVGGRPPPRTGPGRQPVAAGAPPSGRGTTRWDAASRSLFSPPWLPPGPPR